PAAFAVAEDEIRLVPPLPDQRERLRPHLAVAVRLEDPLAAGLAVPAQDRRAVAAVRLADGRDGGALARQAGEQVARAAARAAVVDPDLVRPAEGRGLTAPAHHALTRD